MSNQKHIDVAYFKDKLEILLRDIHCYQNSSGDLARVLTRLAVTSDEQAVKAEINIGWRPIETAPKNTDILLFDGDKPYAKTGLYHVDGELTGWCFLDVDDELVEAAKQPTHWMPIPQPPEER